MHPIFQVPLHPMFLIFVFNLYPQPNAALHTASSLWGSFLRYTGPVFGFLEGLASLIAVQVGANSIPLYPTTDRSPEESRS